MKNGIRALPLSPPSLKLIVTKVGHHGRNEEPREGASGALSPDLPEKKNGIRGMPLSAKNFITTTKVGHHYRNEEPKEWVVYAM